MDITEALRKWSAAEPELELVILFGSASTGKTHSGSDVDIAVLRSTPLTMEERLEMVQQLSQLLVKEIDLVDLANCHGEILVQILTKGQILKKASSAQLSRLLQRMLYEQADMEPRLSYMREQRRKRLLNG